MLFNSFVFICFLFITLGFYYLPLARRHQVAVLVVASFVFYAWANPGLLVLLVTCIGINAALSHSIAWSATPRRAVVLTGIGVVFNV